MILTVSKLNLVVIDEAGSMNGKFPTPHLLVEAEMIFLEVLCATLIPSCTQG